VSGRILTTHVGSLPRPPELIELNHRRMTGETIDEAAFGALLRDAVAALVRRQRDVGVDLVNDGELGHAMGFAYDYGAWRSYVVRRLAGIELVEHELWGRPVSTHRVADGPGDFVLGSMRDRRDWTLFDAAYGDPQSGCAIPEQFLSHWTPVVRGPVGYAGHDELARDIANLKDALAAAGIAEGWMNSVAPASCARIVNEHYATDEELLYAVADAMREEYVAIIDAGLVLQLDDPAIAESWDQSREQPSLEGYLRYARVRVDALNHAIRGLPPERIRFHLCWGSWHGPHVTDLPMAELLELLLAVDAGAYSFEAANARHEHEWRLWEDVELPDDKVLMPGVVSHATNVVEHPELVAQRIARFASAVGPERVVASTDCGLGGRVHPQIAWAKLEALAHGAELASRRV
jgi:5-methyltetrahydropteroyltriglutamate--homocysteine methyltransferase